MKVFLLCVLIPCCVYNSIGQIGTGDSILILQSIQARTISPTKYNSSFYNIPKKLLIFYKSILSEQISASCEFETSCSTFSYQSIEEFGFIKGYFLTADRLTRCGVAFSETPHHLINQTNAKIIDSPAQYYYK